MSALLSRRLFLKGLSVVAAAAALNACSSTNAAINEALIDGTVGGLVTTNCELFPSRTRHADSDLFSYSFKAYITMTNVNSKPVNITPDNFTAVLDGTPKNLSKFGFSIDETSWRTADVVTIAPGEEKAVVLEYEISQPVYDSWWKTNHDVIFTFTCGNQRVTYTGNSHSNDVVIGDIETL